MNAGRGVAPADAVTISARIGRDAGQILNGCGAHGGAAATHA
jgi:hypothetical protein